MDGKDVTGNAPPPTDVAKDYFGKACPAQPGGDQLLVVSRLPMLNGCEFQSFPPPDPGSGSLDVMKLYKQLRPSVDYFVMKGTADGAGKDAAGTAEVWGGSGVTVAKEDSDCLVLTDDHVPKGVPGQHVKPTSLSVVMADGNSYDGTVISSDPGHDLAIVKVNTGANTDKVCKAAAVVDKEVKADGTESVISIGQPFTSHAIYTTTGSLQQTQKRSDINFMMKPLPGEDPDRHIFSQFMPIKEGFSGAGVFNKNGEVVALNDLATSPFSSISTPVTKAMVDDMIAKRTDKPAGK